MGATGRRVALLVATDTYADTTFKQLQAPGADVAALRDVLQDPKIGDYEVTVLSNRPFYEATEAIEGLFADARRDDLLILYFSGHGIKDDSGHLYLTSSNSRADRLASTTIPSSFVREQMNRTKARRVLVILDCCYAGAFPPGTIHRTGETIDVIPRLGGRGSVVITSSSAMEYSYETGPNPAASLTGTTEPSVFTGALVKGLQTGEADIDQDGLIEVNEIYDFVYQQVRAARSHQTPQIFSEIEGKFHVARSVRGRKLTSALPIEIVYAVASPHYKMRRSAVEFLEELTQQSEDTATTEAASLALTQLTYDSDSNISRMAARALKNVDKKAVHIGTHRWNASLEDPISPIVKRALENARTQGSRSSSNDWPIQPLRGEPPLTLFRNKKVIEVPAGTLVDRYGEPDGNLVYAMNTPFEQRSLVPEWISRRYHLYSIARPIGAIEGIAIPWFDQPGGGTAYVLDGSIEDLLKNGDLSPLLVLPNTGEPTEVTYDLPPG